MAVPFSNTKLRVPKGFRNMLEGLSREVLRSQPPDIYAFGTHYFEALLSLRAEGHLENDPALIGSGHEDLFYNDIAWHREEMMNMCSKEWREAALTIQTKYRQYLAKKTVDGMREDDAALKIQSVFRGFMARQEFREMKIALGMIPCTSKVSTIAEDDSYMDREEAAAVITAGMKGLMLRRSIRGQLQIPEPEEPTAAIEGSESQCELFNF